MAARTCPAAMRAVGPGPARGALDRELRLGADSTALHIGAGKLEARACAVKTAPVKAPVTMTTVCEAIADLCGLIEHQLPADAPRFEPGKVSARRLRYLTQVNKDAEKCLGEEIQNNHLPL